MLIQELSIWSMLGGMLSHKRQGLFFTNTAKNWKIKNEFLLLSN